MASWGGGWSSAAGSGVPPSAIVLPARWLFVGDSLTSTNPAVPDWVTTIGPRIPAGTTVTNLATGGNETDQILAQWNTGRVAIPSRVFVLGGVNDIRGGATAASAYANLSALYASARAQLCNVVAMPTMPFGNAPSWSAADQVQLMLLRSSIMADPNVNVLIDLYAPMGQPGFPEQLAAIYDSGDGLHPNGAGTAQMASIIATALGL